MSQSSTLLTINKWLVALFTVLMVCTAALGGNGLFKSGSMEWLVTGHMHLGNFLFVLAVAQMVISYMLWTKKMISGGTMAASALVFVLAFAQIGLGYSSRENKADLVGWHIAVGVALTATVAVLTTLLWTSRTDDGAISTI